MTRTSALTTGNGTSDTEQQQLHTGGGPLGDGEEPLPDDEHTYEDLFPAMPNPAYGTLGERIYIYIYIHTRYWYLFLVGLL